MNGYDCETIRDEIPALLRGELLTHEVAALEQHLGGCAECRAEVDIVRLLQSTLAPVPAGLEARVLGAVRSGRLIDNAPHGTRTAGDRFRSGPIRLIRSAPARLAMAATVAAAVLGGSLMLGRDGTELDVDLDSVSWAAAEDPLLHGGSELHDLSVEELELLLEELDR